MPKSHNFLNLISLVGGSGLFWSCFLLILLKEGQQLRSRPGIEVFIVENLNVVAKSFPQAQDFFYFF